MAHHHRAVAALGHADGDAQRQRRGAAAHPAGEWPDLYLHPPRPAQPAVRVHLTVTPRTPGHLRGENRLALRGVCAAG